ncbi:MULTISPECIES: DUF6344 domain-containing protein [unclassified Streptomyces]|uniref:DUF6344 domain-containing protein n=1 Tax=unclassified Streptomyces TaxID=2593676 RepID=UPI00382316D5
MAAITARNLWTAVVSAFFALLAALGFGTAAASTAGSASAPNPVAPRADRTAAPRTRKPRSTVPAQRRRGVDVARHTAGDRSLPPTMKQRIRAEAHGAAPAARQLALPAPTGAAVGHAAPTGAAVGHPVPAARGAGSPSGVSAHPLSGRRALLSARTAARLARPAAALGRLCAAAVVVRPARALFARSTAGRAPRTAAHVAERHAAAAQATGSDPARAEAVTAHRDAYVIAA